MSLLYQNQSKFLRFSAASLLLLLLLVGAYGLGAKGTKKLGPSSYRILSEPMDETTDASTDPFGKTPVKGDVPHCPAEERLTFGVQLPSPEAFVDFLRADPGHIQPRLDNFKSKFTGKMNWEAVLKAVRSEQVAGRTVYIVQYEPERCFSTHTIKMTENGSFSHYGCCGR